MKKIPPMSMLCLMYDIFFMYFSQFITVRPVTDMRLVAGNPHIMLGNGTKFKNLPR